MENMVTVREGASLNILFQSKNCKAKFHVQVQTCPESLTWIPSLRRDPNARASPIAQSISPATTISPLVFSILSIPLCNLKSGALGGASAEPFSNVLKCFLVYSGVTNLQRILALEETTPGGIKPVLVQSHCRLLSLLVSLLADLVVLVH